MRTIEVKITGTTYYCDCYPTEYRDPAEPERPDPDYDYDSYIFIEPSTVEVEGVEYERDDEYGNPNWQIKYHNFWSRVLKYAEPPFDMWVAHYEETMVYQLELEDNEEFDIHKLQLVVSPEFDYLEDAANYSYIFYDGRKLTMTPEEDDNHVSYGIGNPRARLFEDIEFDDGYTGDPDYIELPNWGDD